jgi:hypothetical protein
MQNPMGKCQHVNFIKFSFLCFINYFQIKAKVNLPVGKNLVDHVMVAMPPFILDKPVSFLLTETRALEFSGIFY